MSRNKSGAGRRPVNVAVVGLGFMGVTHLRAYQQIPGARLVAVCDAVRLPVHGVLHGVGGNIGGPDTLRLGPEVKAYREFDELLADPRVELVDLCVPTPLHAPQAIAALRAGKHVLCEKPLARTPAIARQIVAAAREARGFFMPAMCMRFWPGWAWLKELAERKTYGKILAARFRRVCSPPDWSRNTYFKGEVSGGALLDLHIHDTDFVQYLFGRPKSVFSTGLSRFSGAIDHVVTQYRFDDGPCVYAEGSWLLTHGFNMGYTIMFERATLDFDLARGPEALRLDQEGKPSRTVKLKGPDGYSAELRYMIRCIQNRTPPRIVTAEDGLSAVEICAAEEKSVKTGRVVTL